MAKEVVLDFSQVKPFEPLDPNVRYLTKVTKLLNDKSAGGAPKSHCELTIVAPEEVQVEEWAPDENAEGGMKKIGMLTDKGGAPVMTRAKGRMLFREFSLQPQALPFLYEFLKAADPGVELNPVDKDGKPEPFRYDPDKFMGLDCACSIQNEPYAEQIRARVRRMYPAATYKG